jgi:hypothetical protein
VEKTITVIDNLLDGSATIKESAGAFIEDPLTFFDMSVTKMQSVPRGLLEELQTEALSMRFERQKDRIPTLSKMADRQGITLPVRRMCKWIANEVSEGVTDTSPLS